MGARVICVASAKGGSGKTSLTATLGTFLAGLDKKILLIDADAATNGLTLLYVKEVRVDAELIRSKSRVPLGLFDGLASSTRCDVIQIADNLSLVPASYNLQVTESIANDIATAFLKSILKDLRQKYDYIFIDAQAGLDDMAQIAMSRGISDEVVIVSEYDPMSAAGVERMKAILRDDLTYDRTWVLLNKILPEFAANFGDFLEVAKYLSPIPWDAEVVRAYARRKLAINTETGNDYTLSIIQTIKGLCGEDIKEQLAEWIRSRAAVIRQPIDQQYSDAERELKSLLYHKAHISKRRIHSLAIAVSIAIAIGIGVFNAARFILPDIFSGTLLNFFNDKIFNLSFSGIFAVMSTFVAMRVYEIGLGRPLVERQIEDERFDRQLDILKDRLKRLELLRALDAESLLGHRAGKHIDEKRQQT